MIFQNFAKKTQKTTLQIASFGLLSIFTIATFGSQINTNAQSSQQVDVLTAMNKKRVQSGLSSLKANDKLNQSASDFAKDLASNNYFSHTDKTGQNADYRIQKAGYNWTTFGENLAAGSNDGAFTVERWMNSQGHRGNILNGDFCEAGVGYSVDQNSDYKHYWVVNFGCQSENSQNKNESKPMETLKNTENNSKTDQNSEQNVETKKEQTQSLDKNMSDFSQAQNPAIRAHYPYNSTTTLIKNAQNNMPNNSNQLEKTGKIKVHNFQTCKNAGGELSELVYNSKTLIKCSISGANFAIFR